MNDMTNHIIVRLKAEHYTGNMLGIRDARPRLSWQYTEHVPDRSTVVITLRRRRFCGKSVTQVAQLPAENHRLIEWPFNPIEEREEVVLSVQLQAKDGIWLGEPSEPLHVERAIGYPESDFIGVPWPEYATDHRRAPLVRTEFTLKDKPVRARLYMTAYGLVEAEINGNKVGDDILTPGWTDYDNRLYLWTFDITSHVQQGTNVAGFLLGDGWYRGRLGFFGGHANNWGDRLAVNAQIECEYADGTNTRILSNSWDRRWKCALGPILESDLGEGERYDARLEQEHWSEPGFQTDADAWKPVAEISRDPVPKILPAPFRGIQSRMIRKPQSITCIQRGEDGLGTWLVDMGQNCTQRLRLHMHGLRRGQTVSIQHAEVLERDGTLSTRPLRRAQQHDMYTSSGHDTWWEPRFSIHGFRYATIDGWPGELTETDIDCNVYYADMTQTGWFNSSHALLNRFHSNVLWSMRSNFVFVPTDCPQRDERMGWTGDLSVFAPTATWLYDATAFLCSWLDDLAYEQERYGTVPLYCPWFSMNGTHNGMRPVAVWGDAAIIVPWQLFMETGDLLLLHQYLPMMDRWIDGIAPRLSDDGVWDRYHDDVRAQIGDWLDPNAPSDDPGKEMTPKQLVATAYYARSCRILAKAHRHANDIDAAEHYEQLAEHVAEGFTSRFIADDGLITSDSECAYVLAVAFDLVRDSKRRTAVEHRLLDKIQSSGYTIGTGFAGTPQLLHALTKIGREDSAMKLLLNEQCPGWLYQVIMGGTTTWERWDSLLPDGSVNPGDMTSFNHYALGSAGEWVHERLGGLTNLQPGWGRFLVSPHMGDGVENANVSRLTPNGTIQVEWSTLDDGRHRVHLIVPEGSVAALRLPGLEDRECSAGDYVVVCG